MHDTVTTASRTPRPVVGVIRRLNVGRRTANVEWEGDAPDKGDPGWRSQLREFPIDLLRLVTPTHCPQGHPVQIVEVEKVHGRCLDGRPLHTPVTVAACTGCEFIEEV